MSNSEKKFYLTTPIYYVNARPHIGHAYTTIVADVVARRHRLLGEKTWFLTGTDEHGQKIERSAAAAGIPPQQFADQVSQSFKDLWARMGITNDAYIRTTDERHKQGVQTLFAELYARGEIYLSSYTGQYSVGEEMFVDGPPGTIGPDGRPTETVTEENFFFRLSNFQLPLLNLIESGQLTITPDARRNEVLSFLRGNVTEATATKAAADPGTPPLTSPPSAIDTSGAPSMAQAQRDMGGITDPEPATSQIAHTAAGTPYVPGALKDLSVSRSSFTWGIPVPEPAASAAKDPHVIYVWLDALANYMTALGYGSDDESRFQEFWPADLHLVGKEIIRFHCVYWPAFLLALNPQLQHAPDEPAPQPSLADQAEWINKMLPKSVVAHGWLLFEESKMSKSRGNIVRTETILDGFGDHYRRELARLTLAESAKQASNTPLPPQSPSSRPTNGSGETPVFRSSAPSKADADLFASDVLRYFLLREIPFGQDGSFSFDAMITRYNADLANGYGNLVSRTLSMIEKYNSGQVPGQDRAEWDEKLWLDYAFTKSPGVTQWSEPNDSVGPNGFRQFSLFQTIEHATRTRELFSGKYGDVEFPGLLAEASLLIRMTDGFISSEAPWKLAKEAESKLWLNEVLYTAAESIRILTALLYPILPYSTAKVWAQLGYTEPIAKMANDGKLNNLQWGGLTPGTKLGPLAPIFPRAPKELAQIMTDMETKPSLTQVTADNDAATSERTEFAEAPLSDVASTSPNIPGAPSRSQPPRDMGGSHNTPSATPPASTGPAAPPRTSTLPHENPGSQVGASSAPGAVLPPTPSHVDAEPSGVFAGAAAAASMAAPQITIDDFAKVELRVAKILVAERIPKADKLLRLEVDLGPLGQRQILSGIAEWYTPEDLVGRRIVVITNLAPRKMRGLESHGMLLAASHGENGKPVLATFAEEIEVGARLK